MRRILFILLLLMTTGIYAQRGGGPEKIKALKTAHITTALNLTAAEAEKFWPIYNQHEEQMEAMKRQQRQEIASVVRGNIGNLSDSDANALIDKMINLKSQELEFQKALIADLKKVIPPQKILRLHRAEEEFKKMLLDKFKQQRRNRQ